MRVLQLIAQKPGFTGSGVYLRALMKGLSGLGVTGAAVVGLNSGDQPDLSPLYPVRFESDELPFPVVGMSDVMPYRSTVWSQMTGEQLERYRRAFQKVLQEAVEEFQPDLIHCHHLWFATTLAREVIDHIPVVAGSHGTGLRQAVQLPHLWQAWRPSLERLDHIFYLTPQQEQQAGHLSCPTSVVGAGYDNEIFSSLGRVKRDSGPCRLLYAGKLSYSKGVRELLKAYESLSESGFELALAGSGTGVEAEVIESRARELGVDLLGRLDQSTLAEHMRRSDLFVLPSYYEGLPLVLAEALSCGCRVVVTKLPGLKDWMPQEFLSSGWVEQVDLPRLEGADRPLEEDLPDFVQRLQESLVKQRSHSGVAPEALPNFLAEKAWRGVVQRIHGVYRELLSL